MDNLDIEEINNMTPAEYSRTTFIDVYYKGFHAGITIRGEVTANAQKFVEQAEQMKLALEQIVVMGFEPSWNKQTSTDALAPKTNTVSQPTVPEVDLSIDGAMGQGGKCPVHGTPLILKPAGISKLGKAYASFWSCPTKNADGSYCKAGTQK